MFARRWLIALLLVGAVGSNVHGQGKSEKLLFTGFGYQEGKKPDEQKPVYQEMTTKTDQTMKVMGNSLAQTQTQTFYFSYTPVKKEGNNYTIKQKIEGVKMEIVIAGNKITFDSTAANPPKNPLTEFFQKLVGSEFTLTVKADPNAPVTVEKIEGREAFVKNLVDISPQMKPLLETILSEDSLKQMADPMFAAIPNKEVKEGEAWNVTSKLNMGPIGTYTSKYTFTYTGKDKDKDKITVKTDLKYEKPAASKEGLPFQIKDANLTSDPAAATGVVLFDSKLGRIESSEMKLKLSGTLTIEIAGMTTTVELNQDQVTTTKTSDTNPIPKKS